jgi:hypothetical protein
MTLRRLNFLQWFGLLAGGTVWFASFLGGTGASQAVCNPGSGRWGIPHDTVQIGISAFAGSLILTAELAAIAVFRATRDVGEQDPPPDGRLHFFAAASMVANVVFLVIIVLAGIATVVDRTCWQS